MIATFLAILAIHPSSNIVELKTASQHSMKYYLSLPEGWKADKKWSVVLAIPGAEREFEASATQFAQARKQMPFIVVVPMVVTNGGSGYRSVSTYKYSEQTWDQVGKIGEYAFDLEGIGAVIADVKALYSGDKVFATGFEAGCHTLFALTFRHPEWLQASVPNSPNYQGRGMDESGFSKSPARTNLPIHEMQGSEDPFAAPGKPFLKQWQAAEAAARSHGFNNISTESVPGKAHEWVVDGILAYFNGLRRG